MTLKEKWLKQIHKLKSFGNKLVCNRQGEIMANDKDQQYGKVKEHFKSQFWNDTHVKVEQYDGESRPLGRPKTNYEAKLE